MRQSSCKFKKVYLKRKIGKARLLLNFVNVKKPEDRKIEINNKDIKWKDVTHNINN